MDVPKRGIRFFYSVSFNGRHLMGSVFASDTSLRNSSGNRFLPVALFLIESSLLCS